LATLTLFLFLRHDGVAQSQQAEKGLSLWVSSFHRLQQTMIVKDELWICQLIPGEVQSLRFLQTHFFLKKRQNNLEYFKDILKKNTVVCL